MKDRFVVNVFDIDSCGGILDVEVTAEVDGTDLVLEWEDEYINLELMRELDRSELREYIEDYVINHYVERSYLN